WEEVKPTVARILDGRRPEQDIIKALKDLGVVREESEWAKVNPLYIDLSEEGGRSLKLSPKKVVDLVLDGELHGHVVLDEDGVYYAILDGTFLPPIRRADLASSISHDGQGKPREANSPQGREDPRQIEERPNVGPTPPNQVPNPLEWTREG